MKQQVIMLMLAIVTAVAGPFWGSAQAQQRTAPPNMDKLRQACGVDMQRLCAGIKPSGGRLLQCMRGHQSELTSECRAALAEAASSK